MANAGADPGIFVRGVQPSEKFWQAKKKKKKKKKTTKREKGIGGFSIYCFSMVEIYFAIETAL